MIYWEYCWVHFSLDETVTDSEPYHLLLSHYLGLENMNDTINGLGKDGWELVSIYPINKNHGSAHLKREIVHDEYGWRPIY